MLDTVWQDIRYAARSLRRTPAFTAATVMTLALGIGANAAIFGVVDGVVLHPVPFDEPDRLVALYGTSPLEDSNSISYPNFLDWQRQAHTFEALAIWKPEFFVFTGRGQAEQFLGQMVSADFFSILGVQPVVGRTFTREEDRLGGPPVALLGEGIWRRRFAGDPRMLGQTLTLSGRDYTIIGVVPSRVRILRANTSTMNDVFVPIGQYDDEVFRGRGSQNGTFGLGRLAQGVTLAQAKTEMDAIALNLEHAYPDANRGVGVRLISLEDDVAGALRPTVLALFGAVGFVLLIACANVANLLLARASTRSGEFALRLALGAGGVRLIRQLLIEGLLLAGAGGAAGVLIAAASIRTALDVLPSALPPIADVEVNAAVLGFVAGLSMAVALLVGLIPALRMTRQSLQNNLTAGRARAMRRRSGAQRTLVIAEVALTLVLLIGAGLMIRSLIGLRSVSPGFNAENVLTFYTSLSPGRASSADQIRAAYRAMNDKLSALPGVQSASVEIGALPFTGSTSLGFWRGDEPGPFTGANARVALFYAIGPDYFRTMQIPVLRGRPFTVQDDIRHVQVLIIDEELGRTVFPGEDPIGKRIRFTGFDRTAEIVGIVGHVKHSGLDRDSIATVRSQFYMPYMQVPDLLAPLTASIVGAVVRSNLAPESLLPSVKEAIRGFDGGAVVHSERTMADLISRSLASRRFLLMLLGAFACIALLLSIVGIYGVVSYLFNQRTQEIGVRVALGARPLDVLWMVLSEGGRLALVGIAVGTAGALALTGTISSLLFGVSPTDPLTFASIAVLLLGTTLLACYVPARRATRVDPAIALRAE